MSYRLLSAPLGRLVPNGRMMGCRCRCHINVQSQSQGQCQASSSNKLSASREYLTDQIRYLQEKQWSVWWRAMSHLPGEDSHCSKDSSYYKSKYLIGPLMHRTDLLFPHLSVWTSVRSFHTSFPARKDPESKVEQSVKALKEAVQEKASQAEKKPVAETKPEVVAPKKSLVQRVVDELKHYYHGFRLLFIDIRICMRLLWQMLNGKTLTRRERRQMVRTTADMFRLVPFLVFIIVPFMEFLLPIALKLFPTMLPSTFQTGDKEKEKLKKQLKLKLEMAKFLQDTVHETALQKKKGDGQMVQEFADFMRRVREEGTPPSMSEIKKFSKLFEDEITMEHMGRGQLQALCRVLNIQPIGPDNMLRFQLKMKLRQLKADDRDILREGIENLTTSELQSACRARGMRALGVPEERLRYQLKQWIDMHLNEQIPTSLLLLSRALFLPETLSTTEQLKATLSALPEASVAESRLKAAELSGDKVDNKAKLDLIKSEEQAILQEQKAMAEEKREKKKIEEHLAAIAVQQAKEELRDSTVTMAPKPAEELRDKEAITITDLTDKAAVLKDKEEEEITSKDLEEIESVIEQIAEKKKIHIEKEELKEEVSEYKEDLQDLKEVIVLHGDPAASLEESKAAQRMMKKVDKLLSQADTIIDELHREKEKFQEDIEMKEVKVRRSQELKDDELKREKVLQEIDLNKDNIISINEMVLALKRLQKISDETRAQKILEILDEDNDGAIDINTVLKVIEELSRENVKLNKKQVAEVITLLKREDEIEQQDKLKEKVEKQQRAEAPAKTATQTPPPPPPPPQPSKRPPPTS